MTMNVSRRKILGGMAGLSAISMARSAIPAPESTSGTAVPGSQQAGAQSSRVARQPLPDADYFLSAANPIANVEQRELEDVAIRLLARPELREARAQAAYLWRQVMEHPAGPQMSRFESMIDEYVFNYALKAANADANFPKVLRVYSPPAYWFGRHTPGSRWGGDNPDNAYRIIPIAHGARYEIRGRRMPGGVANVTYTVVANTATSVTLASLEERDVQFQPDGGFLITIDDRPAEGRLSHLQSKPGARYLFVRDSLGDWEKETPNALRVRRLDPPDRGPLSEEEMARHAAQHMLEDVYLLYWFTRLPHGGAPNAMRTPRAAGAVGGLQSQTGSHGILRLADDEAIVVTANSAGAAFRNFVVLDIWFLTIEYWARQSSLNNGQMAPDADGQYTFVVSHQDPGVHNWLDTGGLHEVIAQHRWQGLPQEDESGDKPRIDTRLVKLKNLKSYLPAGVKRVSPEERKHQLARRQTSFLNRFVDH